MKSHHIFILFLFFLLLSSYSFSQYNTNPYIFSIKEPPEDGCFLGYDVNGNGQLDYIFRSLENLYVYDHFGTLLWEQAIPMYYNFEVNAGNKCGAADIDGDGEVEVVALNNNNEILIYNAETGILEDTYIITVDDTTQIAANMVLVNQRYPGLPQMKRDIIIQTNGREGVDDYWEKINRTLIALNLETGEEIWRLHQNNDVSDGIYEGYFGQGHGGPMCADIDYDGIDEVIGGNVYDYNNSPLDIIIPYNYQYERWVKENPDNKYIDHIDAIAVGDFRADIPGLEWIITEEDYVDGPKDINCWHTILLSKNSVIWKKETELFDNGNQREPQNICGGNFDSDYDYCEIWNRSRFPKDISDSGQHPWIYDAEGTQIADYAMEDVLPADFHPAGNGEGIEEVWTIDWSGGDQEYIAGKARHIDGNVVILNAVTGEVVWSTLDKDPDIKASLLYVADVSGDSREELIVCDISDDENRIKIFANEDNNPSAGSDKWRDPLYARVKQSWNYYSPGSYTQGNYPSLFKVQVSEITPTSAVISWYTDEPCDSRVNYGLDFEDYNAYIHSNSLVTNHEVELTGLEPETEYHYRIISKNNKNETIKTPDISFYTAQSVILLNPQGGDTLYVDSEVTIRWRFPEGQYKVNVEISRDSIPNWKALFSQISDSSVTWKVDEPPSPYCLLKVSDVSGNNLDVMEEAFMIRDTTKQLVINCPVPVLEQGHISNAIRVLIQNLAEENLTLDYNYTLSLATTSPGGEFSLDSVLWSPVSRITVDSAASSATFFYRDDSLGISEIIVSEDPLVGWKHDSLQIRIIPENNDFLPPKLSYFYPYHGKRLVPLNSAIQFKISDPEAGSGVDINSLSVSVNKVNINNNQSYISKLGKNYYFYYVPENIENNNWVAINIICRDSVYNTIDTTYTYAAGNCTMLDTSKYIVYPSGGTIFNETNGITVNFPEGAVGDTLYCRIAETDTIPPLPDSTVALGKYYYLGPPGLQLNKKITISVPYSENILHKSRVKKADQLSLYFNDFMNWKKLTIESSSDSQVTVKTNSTGYFTFLLEKNDYFPPQIFYCFPFPNTKAVPFNSMIQFKFGDTHPGFGVDFSTLKFLINDVDIGYDQSNINNMGKNYLFHYSPDSIIQDSNILIHIICQDSIFNKVDTTYTYFTGNGSISNAHREIYYPSEDTVICNPAIGVEVELPEAAVQDTLYFTVGEVDAIPELPDTVEAIGQYYYLGPPGLRFNKKITISLPCNEEILNQAEVTGVDQLPVYFYNFDRWENLLVVSYSDSQVSIQTNSTGYFTFGKISSSQIKEWVQDETLEHTWKLRQNYPNPFNPNTSIKYYLARECFVSLKVYDLLGRFIRDLVNEQQSAGFHNVEWNGTDFKGRNLPSGIYLLQMKVDKYTEMRKMILRR